MSEGKEVHKTTYVADCNNSLLKKNHNNRKYFELNGNKITTYKICERKIKTYSADRLYHHDFVSYKKIDSESSLNLHANTISKRPRLSQSKRIKE
jgi:hypothetical protein